MAAIQLQLCHEHPGALRRRAAVEALSDAALSVRAVLRRWQQRRRQRNELARLDARTLADIGLTRAQADFLINKPFWRE